MKKDSIKGKLNKSRIKSCWDVEYEEEVECGCEYKHKVTNVLTGIESKLKAKEEALKRGGVVKRGKYTPKLSDEEITFLREYGVPIWRYGPNALGFDGTNIICIDGPESLQRIVDVYNHFKEKNNDTT